MNTAAASKSESESRALGVFSSRGRGFLFTGKVKNYSSKASLLSHDAGLCTSATSRFQIDSAHQGVTQEKPEPHSTTQPAPTSRRARPQVTAGTAARRRRRRHGRVGASQSARGGKGGPSPKPPATPRPPREARRRATGDARCAVP